MTADEAIERARQIARERQWTWEPPIRARRRRSLFVGPARWEVWSNADMRGSNVRVVIDDATGKVLTRVLLPR